jgi:cyclopropane fatty-acyl-phospholipid synthase-like methyltransferase
MLVEVENLWPHYRRTVEEWRRNFGRDWPAIRDADPEVFTESFRRRWSMYLEGTVDVFRDSLDLSHIVFAKGRAAEHFPWAPGEPIAPDFVGGDDEVEPYR